MKTLHACCALLVFLLSHTEQAKGPKKEVSFQDCTQIKALSPQASSGVYEIRPPGVQTPFKVYCEMRKDGGWMVFQKRSGSEPSFNTNWEAYANGFGDVAGDHWLGLDKVYSLTKSKKWTLRVDLEDHEGASAFAKYQNFKLGSKEDAFRLSVGNYCGNAGDAIRGAYSGIDQNGHGFSTVDRDNDGCSPCIFGDIAENECTARKGGGWWYSRCGSASLNGVWHPTGNHIGWASGLYWGTWKSALYSVKTSRMMIKSM